jgi:endo-1,3(4)-beta-glucanase
MRQVAQQELDQDIKGQACLDSMYFSGKGLDKFAFILLVTRYILGDSELTRKGLEKLKEAFAVFTNNKQINPLFYDSNWKGIVSVAGCNDPNADFGNTFYNDHHFHYGYFFHAAAVVGQIDKDFGGNWIEENKHWVNALVRDVSNPSNEDREFPISRSFDWYVGHSWAKGLFISGDGKDEESSSEDYHFAYGVKLWGQVVGDKAMEARGNLMLAVMRRAMNKYMIFSDDNSEQPANFIKNKVSGITFENKIDHATYFGLNLEYIQGIHMIPLTPVSSYIRSPQFVKEEWQSLIRGLVDSVDSGWKGILKLNQALFDPGASADFFTSPSFQPQWLDGGMSRTWSIAFAKGLSR